MIISLIHPSRGRPFKAKQAIQKWIDKSTGVHEIEHIISLDTDDKRLHLYKKLFTNPIISDNDCVVEATNKAAKQAKGEILIYLSDDFDCPQNWDLLILNKFINEPMCLKVDDCLTKFETDIVTIPIMNRALYEKLGYFWNPIYKSMYVDQDLYWTCFNNGWLVNEPELKFPHNHYCNRKTPKDETYIRTDRHTSTGKVIFEQRKKENFPL